MTPDPVHAIHRANRAALTERVPHITLDRARHQLDAIDADPLTVHVAMAIIAGGRP